MKTSWILLLLVGMMALSACRDTSSPEPEIVSDSANATDFNASATATAQATSAAQPIATSTPVPTRTPLPPATPTTEPLPTYTPTPTPTPTSKSYFDLGKESLANREIDSAITNFSRAIELDPDDVDAYYLRGLTYSLEDEYDKAIADFEKVGQLDPNHTDVKEVHAAVYIARGGYYGLNRDFDRALADFETAIELDPDNTDVRIAPARVHVTRGISNYDEGDYGEAIADFDSAIANFERIIGLDPDNADTRILFASAYFMRGIANYEEGFSDEMFADLDRALENFERALELDPNKAEAKVAVANAYLIRGIAYFQEGDDDKALADFERILELDPDNTDIEEFRWDAQNKIAKIELERSEGIEWSPCEDGLRCGFVQVPADYRDPDADNINIAVNVRRADFQDERVGYLFVNPGGPGGSGLELVQNSEFAFDYEILDGFDIIGFDPRGVGASEPEFACGAPGEQLALLNSIDGDIDTPEETATGEAAANLCIESMGPVGGLLHSEYVARDMDEIRKALGAEQISYLVPSPLDDDTFDSYCS